MFSFYWIPICMKPSIILVLPLIPTLLFLTFTHHPISCVAIDAITHRWPFSVGTCCLGVTVVGVWWTLINICVIYNDINNSKISQCFLLYWISIFMKPSYLKWRINIHKIWNIINCSQIDQVFVSSRTATWIGPNTINTWPTI